MSLKRVVKSKRGARTGTQSVSGSKPTSDTSTGLKSQGRTAKDVSTISISDDDDDDNATLSSVISKSNVISSSKLCAF